MTDEVSITVAGSPYQEFSADLTTRAISVQVEEHESLDSVIERAAGGLLAEHAARAGIPAGQSVRSIFVVGPAGEVELGRVPMLDSAGRLHIAWGTRAPISALLRAHDAGLLAGDPRYVVVRPQPPTAGVGGGSFEVVADAVNVIWDVAKTLGAAYGAQQAIVAAKRYIERLRQATPVLQKHAAEFEEAGIMPAELPAMLSTRDWSDDDLCAALRVTRDELAVLLPALGFEASSDGSWRVSDDPLARRIVGELVALASGYEALQRDHEALGRRARELFDRLAES